ncbi:Actin (Fragment) [Geodia barretti]|uniref:Actin n=1 Tax=Geodia barretti TaxID=519541 RepID=A0AA35RPL2_GEOBA
MDVPSEGCPVLLTENPFNSLGNREKTTEIMFEHFSTPSLFMANEAVLSLHAAGQTTGVVLSCGDSLSHIVAIQEGKPLPHASLRLGYAGSQLTKFLMSMLNRIGHKFSIAQRKDVREIKEKLCYVALDFQQAAASESNQGETYELPDGSLITIDDEQFRCP